MEFKIEKGIEIPDGWSKYPFSKMEVGDSFFVKTKSGKSAYMYSKRHGMRFTVRKEGDGFRIWRIE